jgi:hypothetical protein
VVFDDETFMRLDELMELSADQDEGLKRFGIWEDQAGNVEE